MEVRASPNPQPTTIVASGGKTCRVKHRIPYSSMKHQTAYSPDTKSTSAPTSNCPLTTVRHVAGTSQTPAQRLFRRTTALTIHSIQGSQPIENVRPYPVQKAK